MDPIGLLGTLAEVSVTLAGFSGLVVAFRSSTANSLHTWLPRERLIFWLLVTSSFSALFFSLLPLSLAALALAEDLVWRGASLALSGFLAGATGAAVFASRRLTQAGHRSVIPSVWATAAPIAALVALLQLANALGWCAARSSGVYLLGPLLLLGMSCLMFIAFLIYPGRRPGQE